MKSNFYVEYKGKKVLEKTLVDTAKDIWKNTGKKVKDIKSLDVYYKPEERTCYYVFNDTITGSFNIDNYELDL